MRLEIRGLRKEFVPAHGAPVSAVDGIDLDVADGELLVVLGPSGSGKTTLLRCIAGLEHPDDGEILADGRALYSAKRRTWVPPEARGMSMVFQGYALWPHMTVHDNVAYPLRAQRVPGAAIEQSVARALDMVGCGDLSRRYPSQLSGGQQQRVAVARAIVGGSRMVLFDEPLSNVDARVREELRTELAELQRRLGFSAVYITHDQTEAVLLGSRVAILAAGQIVQVAPPREIYARPNSLFAAEFLGAANRYAGKIESVEEGKVVVQTDIGRLVAHEPPAGANGSVIVIFRPEHCRIVRAKPAHDANAWPGTVERATFLGFCTEYRVRVSQGVVAIKSMDRDILEEGAEAWVSVGRDDIRLLSAR